MTSEEEEDKQISCRNLKAKMSSHAINADADSVDVTVTSASPSPDHFQLMVGTNLLSVDRSLLPSLPHLQSLLTSSPSMRKTSDDLVVLDTNQDGPIALSDVRLILLYARTKSLRHLFTKLSSSKSPVKLIRLWDYLCRPELNLALKTIDLWLKDIRHDIYDEDSTPDREGARDAVVKLSLGLVRGEYNLADHRVVSDLFNKAMFIASHPGTFGRRMRHHALQMFMAKCSFTAKQVARLNNYSKCFDDDIDYDAANSESDRTSEDNFYDSDDDYYYNSSDF